MSFWIPQTKRELVDWLSKRYQIKKSKFGKKPKNQLYAIYFNIRISDENNH
jgi:hypothetical protein